MTNIFTQVLNYMYGFYQIQNCIVIKQYSLWQLYK